LTKGLTPPRNGPAKPAPGVRLFDPADDRQITGRAIDVGLPPFAMAFLP